MAQQRDMGIGYISGRKARYCYGTGLGIILVDETYPGFPGDVRNPSAFPYPIQYDVARGLKIENLVYDDNKDPHLECIQEAAQRLEQMGCRAIAAECGYFAYFQREIAARVSVPVFLSSLLQVSWAQQLIGPDQVVGILMSGVEGVRLETLLERVGVNPGTNYVVGDVMDDGKCAQFHNLWTEGVRPPVPEAYYEAAERDFVEQGVAFFRQHPHMGAMILECTGFPPFARALQREIDIPLFSWGTLLDFAFSVAVHRDYYGHV